VATYIAMIKNNSNWGTEKEFDIAIKLFNLLFIEIMLIKCLVNITENNFTSLNI